MQNYLRKILQVPGGRHRAGANDGGHPKLTNTGFFNKMPIAVRGLCKDLWKQHDNPNVKYNQMAVIITLHLSENADMLTPKR